MIARLYRIIPLVLVLALIAFIIYFVVSYRSSPNRAKEVLIKAFIWLTGILSGFFALASLYALIERNYFALDITGSFLVVTLLALVVVFICRAIFLKNHPHYSKKPMKTSKERRLR
ncbi:MAG: guanylate cyclase [Raoultibacter sp.]